MSEEKTTTPITHEQFAKFHVPVSIAAALAVVIICLIRRESLFIMASFTSIAIVVFWVLGNVVRYYLQTSVFPPPAVEAEAEAEEAPTEDPLEAAPEEIHPEDGLHDYMANE